MKMRPRTITRESPATLALASTSRKGKLLGNDDTDSHETASRFLIQVNVLACKKHVSDASYEART